MTSETFFDDHPYPYNYVHFQYPEEKALPKHEYLCFYVNEVITLLTTRVFNRSGFFKCMDFPIFNISWGKQYDPHEYLQCRAWQKINHFSGAYLLGKKDQFHKRMLNLLLRVPNIPINYPESHLLPAESSIFDWKKYKFWIIKPGSSSKGEGISIVSSNSPIPKIDCVIQQYVDRPFLINGKKFDIRMYALVTSIMPLRIYLHENGLGRFATHPYSNAPASDLFAHLTNVSLNINDPSYQQSQGIDDDDPNNSKWTLQQVFSELKSEGVDVDAIKSKCETVIIAAIIAAVPEIRKVHTQHVPHHRTSFEMYGIDLLIDEDLNVWIIEVNISPSMSGKDSKLDWDQKSQIVTEMMNIGRVIDCPPKTGCPAADRYEQLYQDSLRAGLRGWDNPSFAELSIVREFLDEQKECRKFHYIFPTRENTAMFRQCFENLDPTDQSFQDWILMDDEQRFTALERGKTEYQDMFAKI